MDFEELFPHVKHSVEDFLFDEEGNIPRSKILAVGSMIIVLSLMFAEKSFAAHRSHSTHRTHSSHRSGGHTTHYTHTTHANSHSTHNTHSTHSTHSTHNTHSNHATHTTHSNHSTHSNAAPSTYDLKITPPAVTDTLSTLGTEELSVSIGTVLPLPAEDTVNNINTSIASEVKMPPNTPKAK